MEWITESIAGNESMLIFGVIGVMLSRGIFGFLRGTWRYMSARAKKRDSDVHAVATPTRNGVRIVSAWGWPLRKLRRSLTKAFGGGAVVRHERGGKAAGGGVTVPELTITFDPSVQSSVLRHLNDSPVPIWAGDPTDTSVAPISVGAHEQAISGVFKRP